MVSDTPSLRSTLSKGQPQYGLWLGLTSNISAEICAAAGYDWLCIDAEHAPNGPASVLAQLQAIAAYGCQVVVRPPDAQPSLLKRYLDIGASNLLIPMMETAEQAAAVVAAVKYPPTGFRGVGTSLARAARWGLDEDYLARANDSIYLLVQIESSKGIDNLDAIASVEGVDGIFVGPADLAASMGHIGKPDHPSVTDAIKQIITSVAPTGKSAGVMTGDDDLIKQCIDWGARLIGVGADTSVLANGAKTLLQTRKY